MLASWAQPPKEVAKKRTTSFDPLHPTEFGNGSNFSPLLENEKSAFTTGSLFLKASNG